MRMIKRYNVELNAWEIGYWHGSQFRIVQIIRVKDAA